MSLRGRAQRWGSVAQAFHWVIVGALLAQGAVGLYMVTLPKRPSTIPWYDFHKSLGLTILLLAVLRLAWRLFDRRPADPPGMPGWQRLGARLGHGLLYFLLFALPMSGWSFDSLGSLRPLRWWGLVRVPPLAEPDRAAASNMQALHEWLFWLLVLVAAGHAAMALYHHFIVRDDVLRRMLPARARPAEGDPR